jgi:hypothetical protein
MFLSGTFPLGGSNSDSSAPNRLTKYVKRSRNYNTALIQARKGSMRENLQRQIPTNTCSNRSAKEGGTTSIALPFQDFSDLSLMNRIIMRTSSCAQSDLVLSRTRFSETIQLLRAEWLEQYSGIRTARCWRMTKEDIS